MTNPNWISRIKSRLEAGYTPLKIFIQLLGILISIFAIHDLTALPLAYTSWKVIFACGVILILISNYLLNRALFNRITFTEKILHIRNRIPLTLRWAAAILVGCLVTWVLLYTRQGSYFQGVYIRLMIYLYLALFAGFMISDGQQVMEIKTGFLGLGLMGLIFGAGANLNDVNNSPFSYSWSEGNRFYDYSLIFGKYIYHYTGDLYPNYDYPGRYGLWGIWFLIPNLPIWVHRLWDAVLWIFTPVLLGILLTRKISSGWIRWGMAFWIALFLMQGPIYPSLLVALIILSLFAWSDKFWVKAAAVIISSFYAGISRYFWAVVPGVWIVLIDLFTYYPKREGNWFKRLWPAIVLGILGILPGAIASWGSVFNPKTPFEMHQPLLFYRWFPNSTYGEGILLGILIAILPVLICLLWLVIQKHWLLDVWQKIALAAALVVFFGMGAIASIKIGGGSNLHNFDLFLTTLMLVSVIAFIAVYQKGLKLSQGLMAVILVAAILPGWFAFQGGNVSNQPSEAFTRQTLQSIQKLVDQYKPKGEILFIDQRQLLTFGAIKGVDLVPDYEKKYMMDQAMGGNSVYFEGFTKDISTQRFALIISDIQKTKKQTQDRAFSEENNAYVTWVSRPLLKYYQPILIVPEFGMELLVPIPPGEVQP